MTKRKIAAAIKHHFSSIDELLHTEVRNSLNVVHHHHTLAYIMKTHTLSYTKNKAPVDDDSDGETTGAKKCYLFYSPFVPFSVFFQ